jgi:hypothetical protein
MISDWSLDRSNGIYLNLGFLKMFQASGEINSNRPERLLARHLKFSVLNDPSISFDFMQYLQLIYRH